MGALEGKKNGVLGCFCIFCSIYTFLLSIIDLKWLIKAWGWFSIFLTFWGISKCRPNLGLWTPQLLQKYFKSCKAFQLILKNISVAHMMIAIFDFVGKYAYQDLGKFVIVLSSDLCSWEIWNFDILIFNEVVSFVSKFWNFQTLKIWNVGTLQLWKTHKHFQAFYSLNCWNSAT